MPDEANFRQSIYLFLKQISIDSLFLNLILRYPYSIVEIATCLQSVFVVRVQDKIKPNILKADF